MRVSIIIPIYNTSQYLSSCLNSVKEQSYKNLEIILVNDGSTDNSRDIAEEFVKKDKRFKVIHLHNGGVSRARNKGMEIATGDYITFIDSDDIVSSKHIENLVQNMLEKESLCICNYIKVYHEKEEKGIQDISSNVISKTYVVENLFDVFGGYNWNKLYDLRVIKEKNIRFDEEIKLCEDLLFSLQYLMVMSGKIYYVDDATYLYLQRENSTVSSFNVETSITSLMAQKKCVNLLRDNMPEVLDKWMKRTVFMCFSCRRRYMSEKADVNVYKSVVDSIICEMYTEVFLKSNIMDRIRLYIYKNHTDLLVLIKKCCKK